MNCKSVNVIDCIQLKVNEIAAETWVSPPEFWVSEDLEEGKILLTISYGGYCHTRPIFPNGEYGNEKILTVMESLYNSVM